MGMTQYLLLIAVLALVFAAYRKREIGLTIWLVIVAVLFLATGATTFIFLSVILICLLLGMPLFLVMGTVSMIGLTLIADAGDWVSIERELSTIIDKILELASKEVLLAIPFFVVAGEIMTQGSLARRLIEVAKALFGWMPGGLAVAGVAGCIFFAAISGSSPVTVIAIGSIMVPALIKSNYPERFSLGLFTTAGSLGILIPPSIPMIVYSIMVGATTPMDPIDLFLAGVVPGAFIGGMLALYSVFIGVRYKLETDPFDLPRILRECRRGFWSLMLPVIILGGIYTGIFTATEAAAVSVVYALVVELFIHGELKFGDLTGVAENSMRVMGALFIIIALAIGLNHVLVLEQVPDRMVAWLISLELNRTTFLIMVNLFLLVVGCFMDIMSAILIIAPMLAPMALAMGIDPIHMGIIFIVNLEIGYCTPPVGLNLFVASTLFRKGLGEIIQAVLAPLMIMLVGLLCITWIPLMSTGLGRVLDGKPLFEEVESGETPGGSQSNSQTAPQEKTLQQLMEESKKKKAGGGETMEAQPGRVKTLQELMQEAKEKKESPGPAENPQGRVKTLQELMQEAKEKREKEGEPAPAEPSGQEPTLQKPLEETKQKQVEESANPNP
jgi:C4-dicarboxylate transporter, DctM subunit